MHDHSFVNEVTRAASAGEKSLVEIMSVPRPTSLSKSATMWAAIGLFSGVDEDLYELGDVGQVAEAIWRMGNASTAALRELFKGRRWSEEAFFSETAVEIAKREALGEMEKNWAQSVMIHAARGVGDRAVIVIEESEYEGIIRRIDEERANYYVQTLRPVKGHEIVSNWIVPFELLDGLPSKASLDRLKRLVETVLEGEGEIPRVEHAHSMH